MSQHISDDLPRLLTGDAGRDETLAAAAHLRECPDCQQELVAAVVAHAALTSARRFAPATSSLAPPAAGDEPALPDLSAVFARARDEAAVASSGHRRRRWLLAAAAAAVVATAGGITIAEVTGDSSSTPQAVTVELRSLPGVPAATATATVTGERMHLDATSLPKLDAGHQYEVWLVADTHLRPLGYIGADRTADLTVPSSVMAQYNSVAISIQRNTQVQYSGNVIARGSYG